MRVIIAQLIKEAVRQSGFVKDSLKLALHMYNLKYYLTMLGAIRRGLIIQDFRYSKLKLTFYTCSLSLTCYFLISLLLISCKLKN